MSGRGVLTLDPDDAVAALAVLPPGAEAVVATAGGLVWRIPGTAIPRQRAPAAVASEQRTTLKTTRLIPHADRRPLISSHTGLHHRSAHPAYQPGSS